MQNFIALTLLLLTLISCGQEPSNIENSIVTKNDLLPTSLACSKVNFHKEVLLFENVNNIFKCLDWNKEFPKIYKSMFKLDKKRFNLLFKPANDLFFGSDAKRNKFLGFLNKNIRNDNVKNLELFISSLIKEYKVLDSFIDIITIAESIDELEGMFPSDTVINKSLETLDYISSDNDIERQHLFKNYKIAKKKNKKFQKSIVKLLNQVIKNSFDTDGKSLHSITNFLNNGVWTKVMFNSIDESTYHELIYFPLKDENLIQKSKNIKEIISDNRYNCSDLSGIYYLDHSKELDDKIEQFRKSNREEFANVLIDLQLRYSLFNNICPYPELNYIIPSLLSHLTSYVLIDGGFDIFKSITKSEEDNNFVLFDFVSSEFFKAFNDILKIDVNSTQFLRRTLPILKTFSIEDFESIASTLNIVAEDSRFIYTWKKLWKSLNPKSKKQLINFYINISLLPVNIDDSLSFINQFNAEFGNLKSNYQKVINKKPKLLIETLLNVRDIVSDESYRDELTNFLTTERALKIITILSSQPQEISVNQVKEDNSNDELEQVLVLANYSDTKSTLCLKEFHDLISQDYEFWTILDKYPKSCLRLSEKNKTISHKIFEWTFDLDRLYSKKFNGKFSIPYGVISGEMMGFYHSILQLINDHVDTDENYIKEIIQNIEKHLYQYGLINIMNKSLLLSNNLIEKTNILEKVFETISENSKQDFNKKFKALLGLLKSAKKTGTKARVFKFNCDEINSKVGGQSCLSKKETSSLAKDMKNLLIKNNGHDVLLKELIRLIHPKGYIKIPYDSKKQMKYNLKLEDLVHFLYDATSKITEEDVYIFSEKTKYKTSLNLIERLEVVIREISFLNNFYGSFFINKVSKAKKYTKNVKAMKKYVTVMDKTARFFRKRKIFPKSTKWAFKNIFNTYDSLWQVNNEFRQNNGSIKQYGHLIQSILTITVKSSTKKSQEFSPLRKPDLSLVDGHNGKFIALVAKHNLLSHLANLLKSNFKTKDELLDNNQFKTINKNFLKFASPKALTESLSIFLKHKNFNILIDDVFKVVSESTDEDFLNFVDLGYYFSKNIKNYELENLNIITHSFMNSYLNIRKHFKASDLISSVSIINKSIQNLDDKNQRIVFSLFVDLISKLDAKEMKTLFELENIINFSDLWGEVISYKEKSTESGFLLNKLLSDKRLNFSAMHNLISNTKERDGNYSYLINIIKLMAQVDKSGKTNLEKGIEEVIISNDILIEDFLVDLFDRFDSTYEK
jgi:hypothetical protein